MRGHGFVSAFVGGIMFVGVYFHPNRVLAEFVQFLVELGALIDRSHPELVVIVGDLNAKSRTLVTDTRGLFLADWVAITCLIIINRESVNTCVRQQGGLIVDITFANAALVRRIESWEVLEGAEILSDQSYIRNDVSALPSASRGTIRSPRVDGVDCDLLEDAVQVQAWA